MNEMLKNITFYAIDAHRNSESMDNLLKNISNSFEASDVKITPTSIVHKSNVNTIYLPIHDKNVNYMLKIINPKKKLDKKEIDFLLQILKKVMENVNHYDNITKKAKIDLATGLHNKNAFIDYCKHVHEYGLKSLGCVYIDVNGLHDVNNTYGHDAGDRLLSIVADRIREVFNNASNFRIGGDEFVIMIPNEKERNIISDIYRLNEFLNEDIISVSAGFSYQEGLINIDDLVNEADKYMFQNKLQRRRERR